MRYFLYIICITLQVLLFTKANSQQVINVTNSRQEIPIAENYAYYTDPSNTDDPSVIINKKFIVTAGKAPVYPVGVNNVWIKFAVQNNTKNDKLYLDLRYTNLSKVKLYKSSTQHVLPIDSTGNTLTLICDSCITPNFTFLLNQPSNTSQTYLLNIQSVHPIIAPMYVCTSNKLAHTNSVQLIIVALFAGTLCAMLAYNLFLFFAVKDRSYLVYVLYTATILLAQLTAGGYMYKYLWPTLPSFNLYAVVLTTNLSILTGITFTINFLHIKTNAYRTYWLFIVIMAIAVLDILLNFFHYYFLSYTLLNYNSILTGATIFITSIRIARKGYRPAYYYFIAWSSIVMALILLALRNIGVLPYNNFTSNTVYIGSVLEATLLSIALADKINILRKEKDESQAESLRISKENEQLIQQQNIILEQKITERTKALEQTLSELKDAQIQLVESEKMASLGQLTAGIAHEINNPINFVKSNVKPLQMDVQDLFELISRYQKLHTVAEKEELPLLSEIKSFEEEIDPDFIREEIESLIGGIEEGAERTAEIVRSLRTFSRLDESEVKVANVHDGIDSTLVLLKNTIPSYIKIIKHFNADGDIECYPSKLNQVFMNILTNAVQAITSKQNIGDESIVISTSTIDGQMEIRIKDSGIGMTEEVRHKMFDPFFTTKDVGVGTGLGMSITFKIIEKHHGKITVVSSPGCGSEIIISIPYQQQNSLHE